MNLIKLSQNLSQNIKKKFMSTTTNVSNEMGYGIQFIFSFISGKTTIKTKENKTKIILHEPSN